MNKKELISRIDSLITSLNEMSAELKLCRQENADLKLQIEELSKTSLQKAEPVVEEPKTEATKVEETLETPEVFAETETLEEETAEEACKESEEEEPFIAEEPKETATENTEEVMEKTPLNILPMGEEVVLPNSIMEFGAEIIGKIVIESAKYADLVAASTAANKKELLNLIMGKSEICKAEILNVVTSNAETDAKISLINAELSEATDYFKSVLAQI